MKIQQVYLHVANLRVNHPIACSGKPNPFKSQSHLVHVYTQVPSLRTRGGIAINIGFTCVVFHVSYAIYDHYMCHNSYRCHCLLPKLSSEIMVSWSTCTMCYYVDTPSGPEVRMLLVVLHITFIKKYPWNEHKSTFRAHLQALSISACNSKRARDIQG